MSELKMRDFKMLEKAPYEKMDTRSNMELFIRGAKDKEKSIRPRVHRQVHKVRFNGGRLDKPEKTHPKISKL